MGFLEAEGAEGGIKAASGLVRTARVRTSGRGVRSVFSSHTDPPADGHVISFITRALRSIIEWRQIRTGSTDALFFPAASCLIRSAASRERTLPIGTSETENQLVSLGLLTRETTAAIRSGPSDAIQSATMASISPLLYSGLGALHPPSRWPRRLGRVSRAVHRDNRSSLASINKWIQRCGSQCQF